MIPSTSKKGSDSELATRTNIIVHGVTTIFNFHLQSKQKIQNPNSSKTIEKDARTEIEFLYLQNLPSYYSRVG